MDASEVNKISSDLAYDSRTAPTTHSPTAKQASRHHQGPAGAGCMITLTVPSLHRCTESMGMWAVQQNARTIGTAPCRGSYACFLLPR